ncbi:MAG TPA: L,D-transpeptidase family protein [Solirubrobacteraceae bacterium]|jgi:lipoprotein-anchoring transpeptidase ErfK/SrfK
MNVFASRRAMPLLAVFLGVLLVLFAAMFVYDHSQREQIAKGVQIAGVDVGGLSKSAARKKVQAELIAPLNRTVTVRSGNHTWHLTPRSTSLTIDANDMVNQAVSASRGGSIFSRTIRGVFGGSISRKIPLEVSYSHQAIRALTARVRGALNQSAQNASVQPSAGGLQEISGQSGVKVDSGRLAARVEHALIDVSAKHSVAVPTHTVEPTVSSTQLASQYPAYIIVDRSAFRLRFYEHLKLAKTYEIAVGMEGLETPAGLHKIEWKQVDPPWYVPKKAWAGKLAGTVVPPGPADPLKARFMSFDGGAGIHGIDPSEYSSIGHDASHGCVRMRIPDVIALYSRTPVGTPVYIV